MKPKVSVIIPAWTLEDSMERTMESVVSQSLKDIEIICVHNRPMGDAALSVLDTARKDYRFYLLQSEGRGCGSLFNDGMRHATGRYIASVLPGDTIVREMYEELVQISDDNDLDFVQSCIDSFGRMSGKESWHVFCPAEGQCWAYAPRMVVNGIYRRRFLEKKNIYFNENEDFLSSSISFYFQVFMKAKRAYFFNKEHYFMKTGAHKEMLTNHAKNILQEYDAIGRAMLKDKSHSKKFGKMFSRVYWGDVQKILHSVPKGNIKQILDSAFVLLWRLQKDGMIDYREYSVKECRELTQILYNKEAYYEDILQGKTPRMPMEFMFPYHLFRTNSRIVIYGAGNLGRLIYRQAVHDNYVKIVGIVDKNGKAMASKDIPVQSVEKILDLEFDYILIGIREKKTADTIRKDLQKLGVPSRKIRWDGQACFRDDFFQKVYFPLLRNFDGNFRTHKNFLEYVDTMLLDARDRYHLKYHPYVQKIEEKYEKYDVIIFAIINFDFRHQRPQHIAESYARAGHRVFYINSKFHEKKVLSIHKEKDNLWTINLPNTHHHGVYSTDFSDGGVDLKAQLDDIVFKNGIRDAVVLLDYPSWILGADYLKEKYGFSVIADYMDDFCGFERTVEPFLKRASEEMLEKSDVVIASSSYLEDSARRYNAHVAVIRNGTEFHHFHAAYGEKAWEGIIGYYGAISDWFDFGKIIALSRTFPDHKIILIGEITSGKKILDELSNVKLLGEIPYKDLPRYLNRFDVCIIPFDASTNLIKATNPVKFYEYLSAGKKIVATEIPELKEFDGKYVYLANDDETFVGYVKKCLNNEDTLASPEECIKFAMENDWKNRLNEFYRVVGQVFPMISIIILCHNQVDYTQKCVESILKCTAYPNYELVLVDNQSSDSTADYLKYLEKRYSQVKVVYNSENRGFAGGNNDGIAASNGEFIVLLNNDTLVTRGWLTGLVKWFRKKNVGIVGPVTNNIGNEAKIDLGCGDGIPQILAASYVYTANHMGKTFSHDGYLAMFCVMFRRKLVEKIGYLDENYGKGYFEDDDYSMASEHAGYKNLMVEDVFVYHYGGQSFNLIDEEERTSLFEKNCTYYKNKWNTEWKKPHSRIVQDC